MLWGVRSYNAWGWERGGAVFGVGVACGLRTYPNAPTAPAPSPMAGDIVSITCTLVHLIWRSCQCYLPTARPNVTWGWRGYADFSDMIKGVVGV